VTDFAGRSVTLTYDGNGDLVGITTPAVTGTPNGNDFPQGKTTRFVYTSGFSDQRLNHNLTTLIFPNEVADGSLTPRLVSTYGTTGLEFDRVVSQSWGGGRSNASGVPAGGNLTLTYSTAIGADTPPGAYSKTTITNRGGHVIELWHDGAGHRLADRQVVGGQASLTDYTYNPDGLLKSITYPAGNRIEYRYDDGAANRLAQSNLLEVRRVADAARGCDGLGATPCPPLVTAYTYDPAFQQLKTLTDARGATTTYAYDARGNLTQVTFPNVTVGPAAPQAASERWTYNAWGQPLTFTDPEGAVTRYEYYASGPATGYRQRIIREVSVGARSALSEVSRLLADEVEGGAEGISPAEGDCFGAAAPRNDSASIATEYGYDAVGNVTAITDGRGVRTDYTVNALNQVVKVTRAAAIPNPQSLTPDPAVPLGYETLYAYDANDNIVRVDVENVLPDLDANFHPTGSHSRDAANPWLTMSYTYDLLDNLVRRTAEVSPSLQAVTEWGSVH
jgi:YD repeat-containing protein